MKEQLISSSFFSTNKQGNFKLTFNSKRTTFFLWIREFLPWSLLYHIYHLDQLGKYALSKQLSSNTLLRSFNKTKKHV